MGEANAFVIQLRFRSAKVFEVHKQDGESREETPLLKLKICAGMVVGAKLSTPGTLFRANFVNDAVTSSPVSCSDRRGHRRLKKSVRNREFTIVRPTDRVSLCDGLRCPKHRRRKRKHRKCTGYHTPIRPNRHKKRYKSSHHRRSSNRRF